MDALIAALGWIGFVWTPGFLLCVALRPSAAYWRNAAVGALVGAGFTMLVGQVWTWLDLSVRPATVFPVSLGVPVLVYAISSFAGRRTGVDLAEERRHNGLVWTDAKWLAAAAAVGLAVWASAIPSLSDVLPFIDGSHHGLFAYRIETLHTLDTHRVLAGDLATGTPAYRYYPLALHLCVALIASVTGVGVNQVFVVGIVLAGAVLFPLGMFVLTRWLLPEAPHIARLSALLAAVFPWFPFSPLIWGAVPLIIAMSQVPAALDALGNVNTRDRVLQTGGLAGVATYGMFAEHNTELVTVALFSLILLLSSWRSMDREIRRRRVGIAAVAATIVALLVLPSLHALSGGVTERTGNLGNGHGSGLSALEWLVGAGNPVVLVLALIGLVVAVRRRWLTPWTWCLAATGILFASTLHSPAILPWVTVAWYSAASRLSYMFGFFAPIFASVGLLVVFERLRDRAVRGQVRPQIARAVPGVLLGLALLLGDVPVGRIFVESAYETRSLIGPDQRAAFTWLANHVAPGERVLNQFTDDSGWMLPLAGVTPIFAIDPLSVPQDEWGDRWYLLTHAATPDRRAQAAFAHWHIRYVYVGNRVWTHQERHFSAAGLRRSSAYREVWHQGSASIFEVVADG